MKFRHAWRLWLASLALVAQPAHAQPHDPMENHRPEMSAATPSPYAGMEKRNIKALSDQEIADLKAGRGMGLALAAELNSYPGPLHTLELADTLQLSDLQRSHVRALVAAMKAETIPIGENIVAEEAALDRLFAERRVTQESLDAATSRIAVALGLLRAAHLRYHLIMMNVLSPEQAEHYVELRGYAANAHHDSGR